MKAEQKDFEKVIRLIRQARERAMVKVNEELVILYFEVGKIVSVKASSGEWGSGTVEDLAKQIGENFPGMQGFDRRGLYRMKQFYEAYAGIQNAFVVLAKISWSHHRLILYGTRSTEERMFYLNLCIKEGWSSRDLERQLKTFIYERSMLRGQIVAAVRPQLRKYPENKQITTFKKFPTFPPPDFKDPYVLEFLRLPKKFSEADLQKAILENLKHFILELGKGFSFIGNEYRIRIGKRIYKIDLLFFHRELNCLVAIELKTEEFKPGFISKMNLYLEALDRQVKKKGEKPSIGILLCTSKDKEVVRFSTARNTTKLHIADYNTKLIDKKLLRRKLRELSILFEAEK